MLYLAHSKMHEHHVSLEIEDSTICIFYLLPRDEGVITFTRVRSFILFGSRESINVASHLPFFAALFLHRLMFFIYRRPTRSTLTGGQTIQTPSLLI